MVREIPLTQGYVALVDDIDYERVSAIKWRVKHGPNTQYASGNLTVNGQRKTVMLHRWMLNAPVGVLVDHRDRNGLNCCRENLRLVTPAQNSMNRQQKTRSHPNSTGANRSGYKGVYASRGKWAAEIVSNGSRRFLGRFASRHDAARAYDSLARELHGEYACLNFPDVECAA